ncbi:MAG: OmpA family protein [Alphaproteobacteria bacterium]|nr:OmpA family protein [Alphaproteobacteria bacterium]
MKNTLKTAAAAAALALALGGCASTPEANPRLLAAESTLAQSQADPATAESGRASLEKAEIALREARGFYMERKDDEFTHALRMGEGYLALAEARGDQLEANRKIAALNASRADIVAQARRGQLSAARAATLEAEARADQSAIVAANAVSGQRAAEARTSALREELASYEQTRTDLGVTLILRDLQFASASSVLSTGAQGRLAPLAAFLAKQPDARIQIIGHTDSQGSAANNVDLAARRAQSVGAYLSSTGVNANRISSSGMGEASPVATNATAAGRAINRRVEVTILD